MACDLTTGLQILYHFSGNANDSSGNGYNGTVNGATLTTDKNSVSNQAYDFDGASDYIETNTNTSTIASQDISVSLWFKADTTSSEDYLFGDWTGGNRSIMCYISSNTIGSYLATGSSTIASSLISYGFTDTTSWHHLVVVYDYSADTYTMYLDNVQVAQATSIASKRGGATAELAIGSVNATGGSSTDGKIDEVWIFSTAINTDTIDALYNGYDAPSCGGGGGSEDSMQFGGGIL